jgi:hypothetical protein
MRVESKSTHVFPHQARRFLSLPPNRPQCERGQKGPATSYRHPGPSFGADVPQFLAPIPFGAGGFGRFRVPRKEQLSIGALPPTLSSTLTRLPLLPLSDTWILSIAILCGSCSIIRAASSGDTRVWRCTSFSGLTHRVTLIHCERGKVIAPTGVPTCFDCDGTAISTR